MQGTVRKGPSLKQGRRAAHWLPKKFNMEDYTEATEPSCFTTDYSSALIFVGPLAETSKGTPFMLLAGEDFPPELKHLLANYKEALGYRDGGLQLFTQSYPEGVECCLFSLVHTQVADYRCLLISARLNKIKKQLGPGNKGYKKMCEMFPFCVHPGWDYQPLSARGRPKKDFFGDAIFSPLDEMFHATVATCDGTLRLVARTVAASTSTATPAGRATAAGTCDNSESNSDDTASSQDSSDNQQSAKTVPRKTSSGSEKGTGTGPANKKKKEAPLKKEPKGTGVGKKSKPAATKAKSAVDKGQEDRNDLLTYLSRCKVDITDVSDPSLQWLPGVKHPTLGKEEEEVTIPVDCVNDLEEVGVNEKKFNFVFSRVPLTGSKHAVGNIMKGIHGRYTRLAEALTFVNPPPPGMVAFPRPLLVRLLRNLRRIYGGGARILAEKTSRLLPRREESTFQDCLSFRELREGVRQRTLQEGEEKS